MSALVARHKCVEFTYVITDEGGAVLEQVDLPVGYVHGANSGLLEKVEQALEGHQVGDTVQVMLIPEEGFGYPDPALTYTDNIENVPEQFRFIGAEGEFQNDQGEVKTFRVSRIEDGRLTLDGNHPLAGKSLWFTVRIVSIRDATMQEIRTGRAVEQRLH